MTWRRLEPGETIEAGDEYLDMRKLSPFAVVMLASGIVDDGDPRLWRPVRVAIGCQAAETDIMRRRVIEEPGRFRVAIGGTHSIARGR